MKTDIGWEQVGFAVVARKKGSSIPLVQSFFTTIDDALRA